MITTQIMVMAALFPHMASTFFLSYITIFLRDIQAFREDQQIRFHRQFAVEIRLPPLARLLRAAWTTARNGGGGDGRSNALWQLNRLGIKADSAHLRSRGQLILVEPYDGKASATRK